MVAYLTMGTNFSAGMAIDSYRAQNPNIPMASVTVTIGDTTTLSPAPALQTVTPFVTSSPGQTGDGFKFTLDTSFAPTLHDGLTPLDPGQRQVSQAGQDFIKGYEKLSLKVYDASKGKVKGGDWTIGYGHKTMKDAGPITLSEAEALYKSDVARIASHVAADVDVPVTQFQFDALVSLRFNTGPNVITPPVADLNRTGHATMGDFTNHYITAGGVPMRGLVLRRAAEWRIFNEGVYDASH